jgi:hypothetical protein
LFVDSKRGTQSEQGYDKGFVGAKVENWLRHDCRVWLVDAIGCGEDVVVLALEGSEVDAETAGDVETSLASEITGGVEFDGLLSSVVHKTTVMTVKAKMMQTMMI